MYHVAVVILNHNSERDLQVCAGHVAAQQQVRVSIILVDNASCLEAMTSLRTWLSDWRPDAVTGSEAEVHRWVRTHPECSEAAGNVYLIEHSNNSGYSAGNNMGIRLAELLRADAVLIANPDMRIDDPSYLAVLAQQLFADPNAMVAASRIIGLDGEDQNPLREASFWEELFWPRWLLRRFLRTKSYVIPCVHQLTINVPKVSGCCMLLRLDSLRQIGYLDENVFLYCEEPILSARVSAAGGKVLFVPRVVATHAHDKGDKGDGTKRMLLFIRSRRYYLKEYSGYNRLQLGLLFASYEVLAVYNRLRGVGKHMLLRGGSKHA